MVRLVALHEDQVSDEDTGCGRVWRGKGFKRFPNAKPRGECEEFPTCLNPPKIWVSHGGDFSGATGHPFSDH